MQIVSLGQIQRTLDYRQAIDRMRDALIANSRGECDTPMPMHLDIAARSEVHIKSSYRRGGEYFVVKIAAAANGMMLLSSAKTGEPVAFLADCGHLTDVRTAAAAAMVARELGRDDPAIGILGSGIQARLEARMHAEVLNLKTVWIWGRNAERAEMCAANIRAALRDVGVRIASNPAEVARNVRLIVTATASRMALLNVDDVRPGTHISAVGSDSPGKQELDPAILRNSALLLADSRAQCEKLGELQHAPDQWTRVIEIGEFCESAASGSTRKGITVCDFTGLGVEDLYIAETCYERVRGAKE